jgi:2-polyprenyl-6-methoxyphenol hydroxylase-like FAD-dependent oxidoreductase
MGGLAAAAAVAGHFEHVLVLERDTLPVGGTDRAGIPQGKHVHALLAGGERALGELFPGFADDLGRAGAVSLRMGLDVRTERPGYDPFPQRDLGFDAHALSRGALEGLVRERVGRLATVELRPGWRVDEIVARPADGRVTGVRCVSGGGRDEIVEADLVVDASGRGTLTLDVLRSIDWPLPDESAIGVDVQYATAVFAIPEDAPTDWKGVFCFPRAPRTSRGALLLPLEGRRWIVTLAGQHAEKPPGDAEGFMAFAGGLRMPTIHDAIAGAKRLGEVTRFGFPESTHRHYERLDAFPRGLLPVADAVCRFNPVYGQGMSVAAQEAVALGRLLADRTGDPLERLAPAFFGEAARLIETPWSGAAIPDLLHPATRGARPANLMELLKFGAALTRLAAEDPAVHTLTAEVQNLLKPRSVYQDPALVARVRALIGEG